MNRNVLGFWLGGIYIYIYIYLFRYHRGRCDGAQGRGCDATEGVFQPFNFPAGHEGFW